MWFIDTIKNLFVWWNDKQETKKFEVWPYSVEILNVDSQKLVSSISKVKEILGLWLKQAKDLLSNLPASAISWISKFDAEKIKEKLEDLGMEVKINKK